MKRIRILLVDDNELSREAIKAYFDDNAEFDVIAMLASGEECIDFMTRRHDIDAIIMDVKMHGMDGLETTCAVKKRHPKTKVIICTIWNDEELRDGASKSGADGYFAKGAPLSELADMLLPPDSDLH